MELFQLPQLYCPFPASVNRNGDRVGRASTEWAQWHELVADGRGRRRLEAVRVGSLVAHTYPTTPLDALQLAADWCTWLFLLDDRCDERGIGKSPRQLERFHARSLAILRGTHPTDQDDALLHALADLRDRLRAKLQPARLDRFIHSVQVCFDASVWEAGNRAYGLTPDVDGYLKMRALTGGLYTLLELAELTEEMHLPATVQDHPLVEQLTRHAVNVVCWANDIFSFEKELKQGDVHNLVLVLRAKHHLTLQEAIYRAAALHDAEVRAFMDLELRVPAFGADDDAALRQYVALLRAWMRGNLDWSHESGRYMVVAESMAYSGWQG